MYEIGWFSTGRDEAAGELLATVHQALVESGLEAGIRFVFSNREPGESREADLFFKLAHSLGLELVYLSSAGFQPELWRDSKNKPPLRQKWRRAYDREVRRQIAGFQPKIIVLAGYMLIVSGELCDHLPMINLHPAIPGGPKGSWQEVVWQLIRARAPKTGVTVHLVTEELDAGPTVAYCSFPLREGNFTRLWGNMEDKRQTKSLEQIKVEEGENEPLFSEIRREGVKRELPLLTQTVLQFARGNLRIVEI